MLQFYYGQECDHCHKMMPLIEKLELEFGVKLERYEIWHNLEFGVKLERYEIWHNEHNEGKFNSYAKNLCPGVPFFYNTDNSKFICGETEYEELRSWAESK